MVKRDTTAGRGKVGFSIGLRTHCYERRRKTTDTVVAHFEKRKMEEKALAALEVALSLVPEHEKADYLKVLQVAPALVFKESDPIKFLRFTGFNAPAAALALIRYWKGRRHVFGENAFLPLTLTGDGALDEPVFDMIRSGISITPVRDKSGRSILFYDTSRRIIQDLGPRHRYFFYVHQYLMENDLSQTEGYVLVTLGNLTFDAVTYETLSMVMSIFPVRLKEWHFLSYVPNQRRQIHFSSQLRKFLVENYCRLLRGQTVYVHNVCSRDGLVNALATHDIDMSRIPLALGGNWSYWQVHEWFEWRKGQDKKRYASTIPKGNELLAGLCLAHSSEPPRLPLTKRARTHDNPFVQGTRRNIETINFEEPTVKMSSLQELALRQALIKWQEGQGNHTFLNDVAHYFCRQLNRGLQRLPVSATAAYMDATSKAPATVWEEESNLMSFLLAEDFHVFFAASRLARYWDLRFDVFRDKKYMAMNQTGEGALQRRTDLSLLDSGFVQLLPHDVEGCSVIFIDTTCLKGTNLSVRINRCLFYMFSLATENVKSQRQGVSVIMRIKTNEKHLLGGIDVGFIERITESLPLRIKAMHILVDTLEPEAKLQCTLTVDGPVHVHHINSKEEILRTLEGFGFRKDGLPRCASGTWGTSQFTLWQEVRARIEWNIPLGLSGRDIQDFPAVKPYDIHEEKGERVRRLNVIHSWRKRARGRIEQGILEDQVADADEKNKQLRKENETLECLLRRAIVIWRESHGA